MLLEGVLRQERSANVPAFQSDHSSIKLSPMPNSNVLSNASHAHLPHAMISNVGRDHIVHIHHPYSPNVTGNTGNRPAPATLGRRQSFKCGTPDCGKSFLSQDALKQHGLSHKVKEYQCTSGCNRKFPSLEARKQHVADSHKK